MDLMFRQSKGQVTAAAYCAQWDYQWGWLANVYATEHPATFGAVSWGVAVGVCCGWGGEDQDGDQG